tara:strand:- start:1839 stop:3383 length:1545 start_codon:yes stop_codon:yes gene_type:complete
MLKINSKIKSYFFKKKLKFEIVKTPSHELTDVWTGNIDLGKKLSESKNPVQLVENINSFNFIRDLKSYGVLKTRALTRKLVDYWIDNNQNLFSNSFHYSVIANRISILCMTYSWFAKSGKEEFQQKLLKSIAQQLKIQEIKLKEVNINNAVVILKSLILGNIFLFNNIEKTNLYLKQIIQYSNNLILPDGGHITRCPRNHFNMLRNLIEVRAAIASINEIDSNDLHKIVKLMGNYFKMFCMPDDNYAFFNGGSLIEKDDIRQTKKRLGYYAKSFELAKNSGYARINRKNINLFVDAGNKDILNSNTLQNNKASIGAIEYYFKNNKIVTNLGDLLDENKNISLLSSTAAHSTVSIDDRNNLDLTGKRKINLLRVKSIQNKIGTLIEIEHDGYKNNFGISHKRTIFVLNKGNDLRGEDQISTFKNIGVVPNTAFIRFHLDPLIETFKLQSGKILLKHKDGLMIHFLSSYKNIEIEKTMVFKNNFHEKSNQIVIKLPISEIRDLKTISCNWSFKVEK